jgi:hypothetical protein
VAWTMDMAKAAGLAGKHNWRSYPRQMLMARATSELARVLFPDVIRGLGDVTDGEQALDGELTAPAGEAPAQLEPGTTPMRRRSSKRTAAPEPAQEQPAVDVQPAPAEPAEASPEPPAATPEPEPLADAQPVDEPPVQAVDALTDAQLQKLNIMLREQVGGVREAKLQLLSELLGRHIESSKDLSISDASRAMEKLQRIADGMDPMPGSGADGNV